MGIAAGLVANASDAPKEGTTVSRSEFTARAEFLDLREMIMAIRERRSAALIPAKASAVRRQAREHVIAEMKCTMVAARQELSASLDEARAKALEQARKLAAETKEVARAKGRRVEF
jgi:hypothetical protein